ncbi:MAG: ATP-binding protein [Pseudomonadota bacterium]
MTLSELDRQFAAYQIGDACLSDLFLRNFVVLCCGVALWFATSQFIMLVWGFGYVGLNAGYTAFLRQPRTRVSDRTLLITTLISVFIAAWYGAMVIYISTLGSGDYLILAACGVVGAALHCLYNNNEFSYSAYVDLLAVVIPAIGVAIVAAMETSSFGVGIATFLGCLFAIGYFCIGFRKIIAEREALKTKLRAELQDQKMRALGQLTSGVAHDFNNLLTVVLANIELASGTSDNKKYLSDAQSAAQSGADLVKQLMAYVSQSHLQLEDQTVGALFERLHEVLSRVLPARITLDMNVRHPDAKVHCDPVILETALLNLVINARDAIGDQPGRIGIHVEEDAQAEMITIHVRDDGPGMDQATLERAVEPFFTTKPDGHGSGLDLSMVQGFAEQSGGRFRINNIAGGGLVATLSLPTTETSILPIEQSA